MIVRGAIFEINSLPGTRGHEQRGRRYCVVIESDRFPGSTVIAAMTSTHAGPAVYRPEIEFDDTPTRILADQIYTVSPERLGTFRGRLSGRDIAELDRALMLKLGLI